MKHLSLRGLGTALLLASLGHAETASTSAKLKVVTTLPDLADVVAEIGGERVQVQSICKGRENTHRVVAKPSHLAAMARADMFVQFGLSLEAAFVPGLLITCRNRDIQPGATGFVNVSEGWKAIGVPEDLSRVAGDIHPQGNPHMNLDPGAGRHVAERVLAGLVRVDPGSEEAYRQRHEAYVAGLAEAGERWAALGATWAGKQVVVYHREYDYLLDHYGIETLGSIEVKPGIPPTPRHLSELIAEMKSAEPAAILTARWSNNRNVEEVSKRTGVPVVALPNMAGGFKGADTWIGMMDLVHARLSAAFDPPPGSDGEGR